MVDALAIIAHPDDETLWAGGLILSQPNWSWFIVSICRGNDADRAPRFFQAMKIFQAHGKMADLDDGPEQIALPEGQVKRTILSLLPKTRFDLILTHGICGEYTYHKRHEETARAVIQLLRDQQLSCSVFLTFAYEDGNSQYLPRPASNASVLKVLPQTLWERKYSVITEIYGFAEESWEAQVTPRIEAFSYLDV